MTSVWKGALWVNTFLKVLSSLCDWFHVCFHARPREIKTQGLNSWTVWEDQKLSFHLKETQTNPPKSPFFLHQQSETPKDAWQQDVQLIILNLEKAARDHSEGKSLHQGHGTRRLHESGIRGTNCADLRMQDSSHRSHCIWQVQQLMLFNGVWWKSCIILWRSFTASCQRYHSIYLIIDFIIS